MARKYQDVGKEAGRGIFITSKPERSELTYQDRKILLEASKQLRALEDAVVTVPFLRDRDNTRVFGWLTSLRGEFNPVASENAMGRAMLLAIRATRRPTLTPIPAIETIKLLAEWFLEKQRNVQYKTSVFKCIADYDACVQNRNSPKVCAALAFICIMKHITPFVRHPAKE